MGAEDVAKLGDEPWSKEELDAFQEYEECLFLEEDALDPLMVDYKIARKHFIAGMRAEKMALAGRLSANAAEIVRAHIEAEGMRT